MFSHSKQSAKQFFPHAVTAVWLIFLGLTVWSHARKTDVPPVYDAGTYFLKGYNVWSNFLHHKFVNPLNVEPESRGPGTIAMSFPFGFSADFRPFYFRSIFFPIVCFVGALYLAAFDRMLPPSSQWNLAILAIFLSSLPLFYHFEMSDALPAPTYWGLVDGFFAGIAALSAGASIRSLRTRALKWWVVAALFSAFSLLVKPAGAVIIVAINLAWGCAVVIECIRADRSTRKQWGILLIAGTLAAVVIQSGVAFISLHSLYLSPANIAAGKQSLLTFQTLAHTTITPSLLHTIISNNFGYVLPITTIAVLLLGSRKGGHNRLEPGMRLWSPSILAASGILLVIGLWFWIVSTDVSQDRYFYPFATSSIICAGPAVLTALTGTSKRIRAILRILWVVPCLNLTLLLVQTDPAVNWQRWSGVSLVSGGQRAEVAQATNLLEQARSNGADVLAYAMDIDVPSATFSAVAAYRFLREPEKPRLSIQFPINWQTGTSYRISDITDATHLIFRPISNAMVRKSVLDAVPVRDLTEESTVIRAWLSNLDVSDGVVELSESSVRVVKVTNRSKLRISLDTLVARHSWPASFMQSNQKEWWSPDELQQIESTFHPQVSDVQFGDVLRLSAVSVERNGGSTNVRLWFSWLHPPQYDWRFFCHVINQRGDILDGHEIYLDKNGSPYPERPIHSALLTFQNTHDIDAYGLAIGIYSPGIMMLKADHGNRDWNDTRVIIPIRPAQ